MSAFDILPLAHGGGPTPAETLAVVLGLMAAGAIVAAVLALARWRVRKSSRERRPCPGCGRFLAPGEKCPVCPPDERTDTRKRRGSGASREKD